MKKSLLLGGVLLLVCFIAPSAFAASYASVSLGMVSVTDSDMSAGFDTLSFEFDNGLAFLGAVGTTTSDNGRFEIEFSYRDNDIETMGLNGGPQISLSDLGTTGSISSASLMANGYLDMGSADQKFRPFIGGGLGFSSVKAEIAGVSADDEVFAFQAMAGGALSVTDSTKIDLQYRFFRTTDPDLDGATGEYMTHNFLVGIRHSF